MGLTFFNFLLSNCSDNSRAQRQEQGSFVVLWLESQGFSFSTLHQAACDCLSGQMGEMTKKVKNREYIPHDIPSWDHSSSGQKGLPHPLEFRHLPGHIYYRMAWAIEATFTQDGLSCFQRTEEKQNKKGIPPNSNSKGSPPFCIEALYLHLMCSSGFLTAFETTLGDSEEKKKQEIIAVSVVFWILISFSHSLANIYFSESSDSCSMRSVCF